MASVVTSPYIMRAALAALWLACASCGDTAAAPEAMPTLELGSGEWQFEPLVDGQRLQLVAGTQGGFHVWLSLRAHGFQGERLRMQLDLQSAGAAPLAHSDLQIPFEPVDDQSAHTSEGPSLEHVGWPAQLLEPWCAIEKSLTVRATVSDGEGRSASATITLVPTAPLRGFAQSCQTP